MKRVILLLVHWEYPLSGQMEFQTFSCIVVREEKYEFFQKPNKNFWSMTACIKWNVCFGMRLAKYAWSYKEKLMFVFCELYLLTSLWKTIYLQ
jgi:hypothetical protein